MRGEMASDGNERRFVADETSLRLRSPPSNNSAAHGVVLRPHRHSTARVLRYEFLLLIRSFSKERRLPFPNPPINHIVDSNDSSLQNASPTNRHSYHGATTTLTSLIGRERFGSALGPKRFSQPLQYSAPGSDIYSYNQYHAILEQLQSKNRTACNGERMGGLD
ncbi:unnamed protein product [Heligmosomoides polygyrus]|uniref:Uncharacterized protein n=1 Tax=Heligmosomoides polygyrus TaxID=6339 RepID=A0A3P7YUU7_HELPZ|nr:unnamed protein product [Heligmosomoides polygyrus]